jgi:hypothetical protein
MKVGPLPFASLLLWVAAAAADKPGPVADKVRDGVARALPLIRKGSLGHMKHRTCFACHHQAIPILALTTARSRGLAMDEEELQKHLRFIADFLRQNLDNYRKGKGQGGQVDTAGYALWTLELGGWKHDEITAAVAEYLLIYKKDLAHWRQSGSRPPSEASPFTATYVAVRGLQQFALAGQAKRAEKRLAAARTWLEKTPAHDTEDRVFRLWALKRVGSESAEVQAAARELIKSQNPDGGWAQTDAMKSDAYATGSALVALHEAGGLNPTDAVYRRGLGFLLGSQLADGSWHVRSRSNPFQTYFESGFPHGKDQFISLAASSWATTALALALPPPKAKSPTVATVTLTDSTSGMTRLGEKKVELRLNPAKGAGNLMTAPHVLVDENKVKVNSLGRQTVAFEGRLTTKDVVVGMTGSVPGRKITARALYLIADRATVITADKKAAYPAQGMARVQGKVLKGRFTVSKGVEALYAIENGDQPIILLSKDVTQLPAKEMPATVRATGRLRIGDGGVIVLDAITIDAGK